MTSSSLSINGKRLWQSLMDLAQIGATPKGRQLPPGADRPGWSGP